MIDGRRQIGGQNSKVNEKGRRKNLVGRSFHSIGVTPNQVTLVGVLLSGVCAYFISQGYFWIGIILIALSGLTDFVDGAIARASGIHSIRGAFIDSVADRVVDTLLFGGLSWFLISSKSPHEALLPIAVLSAGYLVSYQRSKAESLGMTGKGGLMERAERLIGLGVALSFNGVVLLPVLWILFGLTMMTVVQRFVKIWRQGATIDQAQTKLGLWLDLAKSKREERMAERGERHRTLERFRLERSRNSRLKRAGRERVVARNSRRIGISIEGRSGESMWEKFKTPKPDSKTKPRP